MRTLYIIFIISLYHISFAQLSKISSFSNELPFDRSNSDKAVAVGNKYFFAANETGYGNELWVTDGTPPGTYMVKDITPGPGSTVLSNFVEHKGILYFFANGGISGEKLWRSDGTDSGTYLVKDVNSPNFNLTELLSDGQYLYFFPFTNQHGSEIWKSDGTTEGTVLLKNIAPGNQSSHGYSLFNFKNKIYFFAKPNGFDAPELWTTDGTTEGTMKVLPLTNSSNPTEKSVVAINDDVFYFTVRVGFSDELWISDGTSANTRIVKELGQILANMVILPNNLAIFSLKGGNNVDDVWVSDGTNAGTKVLIDLNPIIKRTPFSIIRFREHAYILSNDKDHCLLIKSDGSTSGSSVISHFISSSGLQNESLIPFKEVFFILAFKESNAKIEIFTSTGYEPTITPVIINNNFHGRSPVPSDFRQLASSDIIFKADDMLAGRELFLYKLELPLNVSFKIISGISCFGDAYGALEALTFGGQPPYSYNWSNGSQEKLINNLVAGTYMVTITDAAGDSFISGINLEQPLPLALNISLTSEIGYLKNGSIYTSVTGGTPPYSFLWNTGDSKETLDGLAAGTYTITVTDINNCTITKSITLNRESNFPLSGEIKINKEITCYGENTGELEVFTQGGIPPYTYDWSNGDSEKILKNISAGNYFVSIKDSLENSFIAQIILNQPDPLIISIKSFPETNNQKNGSIDVEVTGGTQPYTYAWNTMDTNRQLNNMESGSYHVTVQDSNNCKISGTGVIEKISSTDDILSCTFFKYSASNKELTLHECEGSSTFKIFDISSKEVISGFISVDKLINLSILPKGVYIVAFYDKNNKELIADKLLVW